MSELSEVEAHRAVVEVVNDHTEPEKTYPDQIMTPVEARQCIEAIKSHVISVRALILELEERQGYNET